MGGRDNVSVGQDEHGERVALIGVPAAYDMGDGRKSTALVAGLPVSYLSDTLSVNIDSSMVEYSIIRGDGAFILQNAEEGRDNYFDQMSSRQEQYITELQASIKSGQDYVSEIEIEGKRWNLYCTKLPSSEWYLLLYMPYNTLDQTVERLTDRWLPGELYSDPLCASCDFFRLFPADQKADAGTERRLSVRRTGQMLCGEGAAER